MFPKFEAIYCFIYGCGCTYSYDPLTGEPTATNWFTPYYEPTSGPQEGCNWSDVHELVDMGGIFTPRGEAIVSAQYFFNPSPGMFDFGITRTAIFVRLENEREAFLTEDGAWSDEECLP